MKTLIKLNSTMLDSVAAEIKQIEKEIFEKFGVDNIYKLDRFSLADGQWAEAESLNSKLESLSDVLFWVNNNKEILANI